MSKENQIFDKILNTAQESIFWKDNDHHYKGVNKAFLDFFGFESQDYIIGKTDEDLNWLKDIDSSNLDEQRVLLGENTYMVLEKCRVDGQERDIYVFVQQ